MSEELLEVLSKVRRQTTSQLPHQKAPAVLVHALESTFREQNTQATPTAYFAALLTTLDGVLQAAPASGPSLGDGDVLPAVLYVFALIAPFVPPAVIRSNLTTLISLTTPLFPTVLGHAASIRSQLGLYNAIYRALERPHLETQGLRQAFNFILRLCVDPRPKVRKRAVDLVKDVLSSPPPPLLRHPYAERAADWVSSSLSEINAGAAKFKGKKAEGDGTDTAIDLLAFLRPVLRYLPATSLPPITKSLLQFPRMGNPYVTQSTYSILSDLLALAAGDPSNNIHQQLRDMIAAVLSSSTAKIDPTFAPAWAGVLGNAMIAYHATDKEACAKEVSKVWKALWPLLESTDAFTRKAATEALDMVTRCFTPSLIAAAVSEKDREEPKSVIGKIVAQTVKALDSLAFARSVPDVLSVISSLIMNLRYRGGSRSSSTAAELLMLPAVVRIAELRVQKNFEYKEAADATLKTAMRTLGPHVILQTLPLNLEPTDRQAGREPRAFLLPLLAQPHPSPLSHFVSYFVPLTEHMFDLQQKAEMEGRQSEAKVWSVLVDQIWNGLPGYCWGTADLQQALTPEFSQLLSQLLYNQPELRPSVLNALRIMVDSSVKLASGQTDDLPESVRLDPISSEEATQNVAFLRTQAESWLAVLFNVFSSIGRDNQGLVGDVIRAWASIAGEQEVAKAYQKLVELFKQNSSKTVGDAGNITAVTQDLLLILLPHLSAGDATALFQLCLSAETLESSDNGVQKRAYKILAKLCDTGRAQFDIQAVVQRLEQCVDAVLTAANKDRFRLLSQLVLLIPTTQLHLIVSIIPEAVLGTKETSDKARDAAFDLLVAMGHKMAEGGVVTRSMVDGMDQDGANEVSASIEEYMTMVAGGLAGASPHMISASITAIARLQFEFIESISPQMLTEIFATSLVFVTSANREIVRSVLGYIKLAIHTMPADLLHPHLKDLVPALLRWSHDHKNHFKFKVRHIFERLIRRFDFDELYALAGEAEARKVLVNIKKRKDRAKRKRAARTEDDEDEEPAPRPSKGDAFEDVLYGSESELEDSDDEDVPAQKRGPVKGRESGTRLRVDDDEPMDLLQGAASRITNASNAKRRKPGQDAARFKTDDDTGKMVIDQEGDEEDEEAAVEGDAYKETITSADGFTRGPNGRVKFNKDNKKRRRDMEDAMDEDIEMADGDASANKKNKRRQDHRLGHEFKAKKAGGDVKKQGVEPYAYLPLSQAAKRHNRGSRMGVAGKR